MNDICNFLPHNENSGDFKFYHFVYESGFKRLRQPFCNHTYHLHLAVKGNGIFKTASEEKEIPVGTLFFSFPNQAFELLGSNDFAYIYITFDGVGSDILLSSMNITEENNIFYNYEHLIEFWMSCIRRVNSYNSITLTDSVLKYTLSFLNNNDQVIKKNKFDEILEYLEHNFANPQMSIKRVSDIFFYNEKYLSALFVKKTGEKFTEHINKLRINYALKLINTDNYTVSELSAKCGFTDPFYFSKIFKKTVGVSPSECMKSAIKKQ